MKNRPQTFISVDAMDHEAVQTLQSTIKLRPRPQIHYTLAINYRITCTPPAGRPGVHKGYS